MSWRPETLTRQRRARFVPFAASRPLPWQLAAAVFLAVAGTAVGFGGVFRGYGWFVPLSFTVGTVVLAQAWARALRFPAGWVPVVGAAVLTAVLTLQFLASTALLGFIPTSSSLGLANALIGQAADTVARQVAPVEAGSGILFVLCLGVGLITVLTDLLAVGLMMPAASGIGPLMVAIVPATIKVDSLGVLGFLLGGAGFLSILALSQSLATTGGAAAAKAASGPASAGSAFDRGGGVQAAPRSAPGSRESRAAIREGLSERWTALRGEASQGNQQRGDAASRTASVTLSVDAWWRPAAWGAVALILALGVSTALPGFTTGTFPQGSRFNPFGQVAGLSPLLALGSDLRSPTASGSFTVATTSDNAPYLRTTTVESFAGDNWQPTVREMQPLSDTALRDDFAPSATSTTPMVSVIEASDLANDWLPAPYAPQAVTGLSGSWRVDTKTLSIKGVGSTTHGQSYQVSSASPVLTPEVLELARARPRPTLDPIFMSLPTSMPPIIRQRALEVTAAAGTPYEKAMALQNYLRGPAFTYSLQTPVSGNYDGTGMDVLATFLQVKSGYCVHFSAAMAVMAREAGIPSRIAVGFAPGRATSSTTDIGGKPHTQFEVDGTDAHAWPELYFEGLGWVPFEPTPSRGVVPGYAQAPVADATTPPGDTVPTGQSTSAPGTSSSSSPSSSSAGQLQGTKQEFPWWWLSLPLALMLATLPAVFRALRRRRRTEPGAGIQQAWAELQDASYDHGLPRDASDTPRRFVQRLAASGLVSDAGTPVDLGSLVDAVERLRYGPGPAVTTTPPAALRQLRAALTALKLHARPARRLRALLLPASLARPYRG
ncbi:transglutaminase TgpA family protein [Psychromicrobium xiongbiense]|uniref:transglutaminase TgpA family protein n=1 Tax=Psychromicrobium xiongbiense TaxID=3051184 RepID=UPI0025577095|nr:DUF3488 and transglutaminase-like domain-containing protein [Psychromicrobium sp. YIM S02556]